MDIFRKPTNVADEARIAIGKKQVARVDPMAYGVLDLENGVPFHFPRQV